jgi:Eukaryotic membrane protein family
LRQNSKRDEERVLSICSPIFDLGSGKEELGEYNKVFDILKIHRLERFMATLLGLHLQALFFNLFLLPYHILLTFYRLSESIFKSNKVDALLLTRLFLQTSRMVIIGGSAALLVYFTNPSVIYHTLRGQSTFKLYMIKAVNEIVDLILKGYGQSIIDNFTRSNLIFTNTLLSQQKSRR